MANKYGIWIFIEQETFAKNTRPVRATVSKIWGYEILVMLRLLNWKGIPVISNIRNWQSMSYLTFATQLFCPLCNIFNRIIRPFNFRTQKTSSCVRNLHSTNGMHIAMEYSRIIHAINQQITKK